MLKLNSYSSDIKPQLHYAHKIFDIPEEQALSDELSSGSPRCHPQQDQSMVDTTRVLLVSPGPKFVPPLYRIVRAQGFN